MREPGTPSPKGSGPKPGLYVLKTDGGITREKGQVSGRAAIGVVLKDPKYRDVAVVSEGIGCMVNHHVAEYKALIKGFELARRHGIERIRVFLDSALVVHTVNGDWDLKAEHLKGVCAKARGLAEEFLISRCVGCLER